MYRENSLIVEPMPAAMATQTGSNTQLSSTFNQEIVNTVREPGTGKKNGHSAKKSDNEHSEIAILQADRKHPTKDVLEVK